MLNRRFTKVIGVMGFLAGAAILCEHLVACDPALGLGGMNPCATAGNSCSSDSECCQTGDGIGTAGAMCTTSETDTACRAVCSTSSDCYSGCCAQVQGQSYSVCADPTYCGALLGDPCHSNTDCGSGLCTSASSADLGWCTALCTGQECGSNSLGLAGGCSQVSGGASDYCFPGCASDAYCNQFPCGDGGAAWCSSGTCSC